MVIVERGQLLFRVCDSGLIFLMCGVSFLVFDKIEDCFRDGEFFITGVFIFRFDQVFRIVTVGHSTQALNMVF